MNLSYWEYKSWLSNIDYTIIGSGIVGLNCALSLKERFPNAKVLVLERGILPQGASTKNAGFACFGSISEIVDDLKSHSEEEVVELVQQRKDGIQLLRKNLGDIQIDYQNHGGHEVFMLNQYNLYDKCLLKMDAVNKLLQPIFKKNPFVINSNQFAFKNICENYITNTFESQLDTGKMIISLLNLVQSKGITILNAITVEEFSESNTGVSVKTNQFEFETKHVLIATNGFASQLIPEKVVPTRAQVLITKPIKNLALKGTFHLDEGYYYFRNVKDRVLFGGGRNLDFKGEETSSFGETNLIQNKLEELLRETILPNTPFEIESRWSGIMGKGKQKKPIVKQLSNRVFCGVRMGGMGVAIGSLVGKELAELV
ncbi:MAG: FAD-dependent oxidoreductase [Cellulophaga sp.]